MIVIGAILSPYYTISENQKVIDEFITQCLNSFSQGLGPISSGHARHRLLDNLEKMIKDFKNAI